MVDKTGILLINLGTPSSPNPKDVYRYLIEFLTDSRVIDYPWLLRQLLVRGAIVPRRYRQSARSYQEIWTPDGSPLMAYAVSLKEKLQKKIGSNAIVEIAMRYQTPSIQEGLENLLSHNLQHLIIVPLFPQYASATTGSIHQEVMRVLSKLLVIPKLTFIDQFATHPQFIGAVSEIGRRYPIDTADHIVFSFHGLPERQITKADRCGHCVPSSACCSKLSSKNHSCYAAQCYATARAITKELQIPPERYTVSFQSRLGKEPWLQPYTSTVIQQLGAKRSNQVLVFCPAFVCDCLETIYEIGVEYSAEFKHAGGGQLSLVQGLNAESTWVSALEKIIFEKA